MGLKKYKSKRSFKETPEPTGGKANDKMLRFVIQKHDASHLHYDFRLEMEGVLKSWAVPKGPSTDPSVKRLAMMVEDHPYDYRTFEGTIPAGNYGAGTVMVWDEGTYEPFDPAKGGKAGADKALRHQLHAGKIKFRLHGEKLNGGYALIKAHGRGENGWLLMKLDDEYASEKDVTKNDTSVVSGKDLLEIGGEKKSGNSAKLLAKSSSINDAKKTSRSSASLKSDKKNVAATKAGNVSKFPSSVKPMLATLVDRPPVTDDGWVYEVKWDGYRALALMNGKKLTELKSRNDKSFDEKFYPILAAIKKWNVKAVVDGEIVVINDKGISDFGALQNWRSEADGNLIYYVFDILWLDGRDLTSLPLMDRREVLRSVMPDDGSIRLSETFDSSGEEFLGIAKEMGMEGIVAKKAASVYQMGSRNTDWLKIKSQRRQEVVIGGFTNNDDSGKLFSALLVGVYSGKQLIYTGKIGTGFTEKIQREMMQQFKPLIAGKPPFSSTPDVNKPSRFRPDPPHAKATWLKPKLVCEVSFTEMTSDGVMRHPSFEGMRVDKGATEVVLEKEKLVEAVTEHKSLSKKKMIKAATKERKTFLNPTDETQVRDVEGHSLKFTNLSKIYWPKEKITKRDMLNYYYRVAPYILPYLKDRPQSLNRFPDGIDGKSFYQKDITGKVPDWVATFRYHSSDSPEHKHFMVPKGEADILLMASLGAIELNPWSSRVDSPDNPDWCIIDLDPSEKTKFDQVIEAAQVTRSVLDQLKVASYCKTSGSTGLHIYIPLGRRYTYEQSKEFARVIARLVNKELPKTTSVERTVAARGGKMYVDFLQNRPQATLAAPYSLRPKPGATVSMPVQWDEVKKGLSMKAFTIHNAVERIESVGDIFRPVIGKGIDLDKVIKDFS